MNKRNTRKLTRMKRVRQFCSDNQLDAHPAVVAESTALDTCITALESAGIRQAGGAGSITSAVDHRLQVVTDLHQLMASLAKAAKRLDRTTYPEVAGKMRMRGATDSFPKLLTRALLFKETLAPIKAAFVALGAPADVDTELDTLISALQLASNRKTTSIDTQINGTLSIEAKAREGIAHIQTLDAIFTQLFRKDPVMLAQWNVVKRATPYSSAIDTTATNSGNAVLDPEIVARTEASPLRQHKVGGVYNPATAGWEETPVGWHGNDDFTSATLSKHLSAEPTA